ncbi:hypothetical protein DL770_005478 [Monosporascus sp. CRB-9-2]|nr:hypothetical protein DL770_005478 [Monosporascus sp. CRB-9-2]
MACADQYALCNPSTLSCTTPAGLFTLTEHVWITNKLKFNTAQLATAGRIVGALADSSTFGTVSSLRSTALWANNQVVGTISPSLPDNQWQIEVLGWFQTNLAKVQAAMLDYASNTAGLSPFGSVEMRNSKRVGAQPSEAEDRAHLDQCANQLVRATGEVQNFSVCGVLLIVCVSTVIILLDCLLERIVDFSGRRDSVPRRARQADNKLHLLRLALRGDNNGGNGWELGQWDIPVQDNAKPVDRPTISNGLVAYAGLVGGGRVPEGGV